jgi:acetyl esterase/lipase
MVAASFLLIAAPAIAADVLVHRDLPYAKPQSKQQRLDVYTPAEGENHPMALWIHGGGWITGDKPDYIEVKSRAFSERGFILVSINYRLVPAVIIGGSTIHHFWNRPKTLE